ncbi:ester cyclase [Pseudonocardia spinosispora]|uniref:ester cyclase n=1 Tax=Pseudonocardia spinosispora TaxID=103441 RepID=UPI00040ACB87|nr:nuclear transport factor 2 family protein [Pseudonocardia spinosispora]
MGTDQSAPSSIDELVRRYNKAWNDHDLEAILAMQTPDSSFVVHGMHELLKWEGIDECRNAFEYLMKAWPDYSMTSTSLHVDGDSWVCHQNLTGTLALPWQMGGRTYEPTGKTITIEIVDLIRCEGNLVKLKEGWMDGLSIHKQLTES